MAMIKLKSVLIACTLLFFAFFINGCCEGDGDCQDDLFCNGKEYCSRGYFCMAGTRPCGLGQCDEDADRCTSCWTHEDCEDGDLCTLDQCLTDNTCFNVPIECFDGKECNPDNGLCEYL